MDRKWVLVGVPLGGEQRGDRPQRVIAWGGGNVLEQN